MPRVRMVWSSPVTSIICFEIIGALSPRESMGTMFTEAPPSMINSPSPASNSGTVMRILGGGASLRSCLLVP